MENHTNDKLKDSIIALEKKRDEYLIAMKENVQTIKESMKPKNIFKSAVESTLGDSAEVQSNIVNTIAGLGVGYVAKKLLMNDSKGIKTKIAGTLMQFVVANLIAQNGDTLKECGKKLIDYLKQKKEDTTAEEEKK